MIANCSTNVAEWMPELRFREQDRATLWFHDQIHHNPPATPMEASIVYTWARGTQVASEWIQFPYSRGFQLIINDGRLYPSIIPITDPKEIKAREAKFGPRLMETLDNWHEFYGEAVTEWSNMLNYLKSIDKQVLSLERLLSVLKEAEKTWKRAWELHFICMYPSIAAYMTFEKVCQKYNINERDMRIFLQGFDTKMFELDRALWKLVDLAQEMKVAHIFNQADKPEDVESLMKESRLGQVWWSQLQKLLEKFGRRTTAAVLGFYYKTWIEDPYPVLSTIKTYIQKGGFDFEEHSNKLIEEREKSIERTLTSIPAEERDEFVRALKYAQVSYPFNEDHNYYVEQWTSAEVRYVILECGNRLVKYGVIKERDDVFFLTVSELKEFFENIIENEKIGLQFYGPRISYMIYDRKKFWEELREVNNAPFIGTIPESAGVDPVYLKIWGMTDEVIRGSINNEHKGDRFEGFPGSPGFVEGTARVIFGYDDFETVQPGEILVAPFTNPSWTPLFSKIGGVCTDSGGMLAHAAICAREYDIPAVVGTITRGVRVTEHIKTGDRIRIDGTNGVVEVLK
jgi:pyruvate,water dikinase